jgi:DNA polymerase-1
VSSGLAGSPIAVDTETDGGPVHGHHTLRLVSVSDGVHTVVLDAKRHRQTIAALLAKDFRWVMHNAAFDVPVLEAATGIRLDPEDTMVLAHLVEPRAKHEGGTGLALADLAQVYLGEEKQGDELKAEMARGGWSWATVPADNEVYVRYAAQDAALTARLRSALDAYHPDPALAGFEREVAASCRAMEARGVLVDREYTHGLVLRLLAERAEWQAKAAELGVDNVNSVPQVRRALGLPKADEVTLRPLVKAGDPLAVAIKEAKGCAKRASSYAGKFLSLSDYDGRVHARIRALQARTARMSISDPPLQQLPSGEWQIRRCLIADPGQVIWSVDFAAVELRVVAALSGDRALIDALTSGGDIHDQTTELIFGAGWAKPQRQLAKIATYATLYGGGVKAIQDQAETDAETAKAVRDGFFRAYPGVGRWARATVKSAEARGFVITRTGRRLPVDRGRSYAATNYVIQSTARDVFAAALLDVEEAGLGRHLLLPIHDELLGQAPEHMADDIAVNVSRVMARELDGVPITTDFKVGKRSWGSLYGAAE